MTEHRTLRKYVMPCRAFYVIEVKDCMDNWRPARSLESHLFVYETKKQAENTIRAWHEKSGKFTRDALKRFSIQYRIRAFNPGIY